MKNIKKIVREKLNSIGSTREDLLSFFEQECLRIRSEYNTTEKDPYDDSGSHPACNFFTDWAFYEDIEETGEIWNDDDTFYKIDPKKRNMKPEEAEKIVSTMARFGSYQELQKSSVFDLACGVMYIEHRDIFGSDDDFVEEELPETSSVENVFNWFESIAHARKSEKPKKQFVACSRG
jgi:hypothetical protein